MRLWQQISQRIFPPAESIRLDDDSYPRHAWRWAFLSAAAAFLICVALANRRGLWIDEFITLNSSKLPVGAMVTERLNAGHSPLFFFYTKAFLWMGESNYALRFTSALMAALNVLALTGLVRALRLRRVLPAVWILAPVLPYWVFIGNEYRYMMFLTAAVSGMLWLAVRYVESPDARHGAALAAAAAGVAWLHASAQIPLVLTGIFIAVAFRKQGKSTATAVGAAWPLWAGLAGSIPFLARIAGHKSIADSELPNIGGTILNLLGTVLGDVSNIVKRIGPGYYAVYAFAALFVALAIIGSRRILIASGRSAAWNLIAALLIGMPAVFLIFCIGFKNHQGPVRYLATYAIPCTICLAIYFHALWNHPPTRGLAVAGGLLLLTQAVVVGISQGEMLREGIRWIISQRRPEDSFLVSHIQVPEWYYVNEGGNKRDLIRVPTRENDKAVISNTIKVASGAKSRGFGVLYHTNAPVLEALKDLRKEGFIFDLRRHKISRSVTLLVWIRSPQDAAWLKQIEWPDGAV